jgi:hypothetical protein
LGTCCDIEVLAAALNGDEAAPFGDDETAPLGGVG